VSHPLPLREQLKALESLQELDLKIDQVKKRKAALPVTMKALEDAFLKAKADVSLKQSSIEELERLERQSQAALDLNQDRLTRANSKLENVANTSEYQAASKEIEQLKKMSLTLQEQIKKSGDDIVAIREELVRLDGVHDRAKAERDEQASKVQGELDAFQAEIERLSASRAPFLGQVEVRIVNAYERMRGARGGMALVPAAGGRCSGCNMMLPAQQYNDVQRGTALQSCPSCHRILFLPQS
jgi:predicted  nucleic acid-binding Zn-ribbon protein